MKCNFKTMLSVAIGLAAAFGFAYFAVPGAREFIRAASPVLLFLLCPLSMLLMMGSMRGGNQGTAEPSEQGVRNGQ